MLNDTDLKAFLEEKVAVYNTFDFIENDPVCIPHRYHLKEDIEIAGFLAATISWGNRKTIVRNAIRMLDLLGESPYDFVMSCNTMQLQSLDDFVHRTFNGEDYKCFIASLKHIYTLHGGLEAVFNKYAEPRSLQFAIHRFKQLFFEKSTAERSKKHVSDPMAGSSAKRINMYLRWMVRNDKNGVDLGIWTSLHSHQLSCPLDIHTGNVARKLGLLDRIQNDARAVTALDESLRKLDPVDPVKYDFALFGLGIFEGF
jgi:uncharacterized protein (TIGR02757 family)